MNETIVVFAREQIKEGLAKLEDAHRLRFNRMYSHDNLQRPVNEVVDNMPEDKLNWALSQVERSMLLKFKEHRK